MLRLSQGLRQVPRRGSISDLGFQSGLMVIFITFVGVSLVMCSLKWMICAALQVYELSGGVGVEETGGGLFTGRNPRSAIVVGGLLFVVFPSFFIFFFSVLLGSAGGCCVVTCCADGWMVFVLGWNALAWF
ncbi:hypothetical protein BDV06DRAFT_129410 [Aspergillus oleicola]